jgi:AcrR family transcriptional regulator
VTFRAERGNAKSRAHSAEDKAKVRQAFIEAGRRLFSEHDPAKVSLRAIASEAGYSPGSIYQYFSDHRELGFAIRELDMNAATDSFDLVAKRTKDPTQRLRKLFLGSVHYWLQHIDHFDVLFTNSAGRALVASPDGIPFGRSDSVLRSLKLYRQAVTAMFDTLPRHPLDVRLATDTLIATTHGIIAFQRATRSMEWSDTQAMAECAIDALLEAWTARAKRP